VATMPEVGYWLIYLKSPLGAGVGPAGHAGHLADLGARLGIARSSADVTTAASASPPPASASASDEDQPVRVGRGVAAAGQLKCRLKGWGWSFVRTRR
jgi:hypothetical protein